MNLRDIKKLLQFDTAGRIAIVALLLCSISGALLAIPYDFSRAYQSIFELLMFNPVASFARNLHYWSAQLFFIFVILHLYDHLSKSTETSIKSRQTWLILCLVIIFLGYEMISGFILKGDAAGMQARRIVASILESIPFIGKMLGSAFTGSEDHWMVVYVQHIATGTLLLFIGIYEHVRRIRPKLKTFSLVLLVLILISLVFRAPLGLTDSSELKGPWFFVGIQEILHWTSNPGYLVVLFLILLIVLYYLPVLSSLWRNRVKKILLTGSVLYLLLTFFAFLFRGENWQLKGISDNVSESESVLIFDPIKLGESKVQISLPENQKSESCLVCHGTMKGLSESHNPAQLGCYACHKGDPFSSDKVKSHKNMIRVPGNFSNAMQTCGTQNCHPEIAGRMMKSLMTTQSGIIGVDKFVFQETKSLNDTFHVQNLGHSATDTHLRNLCASCHLGNEKTKTGNAGWLERGGGCNACHLVYSNTAAESMKRMQSGTSQGLDEVHPTMDIQVPNDRCKSCHSRSGRISLNYEGWNETSLSQSEAIDSSRFSVLPDDRSLEFVQADIHHQKGMACIDCHNSYEIMGDGKHQIHKEDAVNIQCIDCHPSGKPNSEVIGNLPDRESLLIAGLRKYSLKNRVVVTSKGAQTLLNTSIDSLGKISLMDKLTNRVHPSKPILPVCNQGKGHDRLSCESCHSAWVPQCIGCHNTYENGTPGFDLLTGKQTKGTWVEFAGKNFADLPVLGVSDRAISKIVTVMPGMILSIDKESFETGQGNSFHRLYAPASAHTTQRQGRGCKSCHNDPLAIGFGRGELKYAISGKVGKWRFEPRFAPNKNDSLPEDAWVGFLKEAKRPYSTRDYLRPFNVKEQKRILEVGSCLTCHEEKSEVMERALLDFDLTKMKRSINCIVQN